MRHGLEGHSAIPLGDVACGRGRRATCTLRCLRLPVAPPSLTTRASQVLSD